MTPVRFVMVGGFLGAGKTTMLARLARHYQSKCKKVGIITNDQAENLVDTHTMRGQGFAAEEIPGGCFCCRFDALMEAAAKLTAAQQPDLLLAEPVGSCTDLIATVVQPIKRLFGRGYVVAPYAVLVDPVRARQILLEDRFGGFSAKVAYIYDKQLEEADAIAVNKVDMHPTERVDELIARLIKHYPNKRILSVSAVTGLGMDELLELLESNRPVGMSIPDVDYDTYADGEAELGWLNSSVEIKGREPFSCDAFLLHLAAELREALAGANSEPAHVKLLLEADGSTAVANLSRGDEQPVLSKASGQTVRRAQLILNARVHMEPTALRRAAEQALELVCRKFGLEATPGQTQDFKPGRPVPTHRYAEAL